MNHVKILLVDDDVDDQFIFIDAINEIAPGIECKTVNNGLEAIDHLQMTNPRPSLIFLDLNMPFMNGFECLVHLKKDNLLKDIPVIIFTTSDSPREEKLTKELGAQVFLTKTSNFKLLKAKLLDILQTDFSKLPQQDYSKEGR